MGRKRWVLSKQEQGLVEKLSQALKISPLVAKILLNRGIDTVEKGKEFLGHDLANTPDPFHMLGMEQAVRRIERALSQGERIVIYGDYDADGQTATALLVSVLRNLARSDHLISYYLPHRLAEGYGLHRAAVEDLAGQASLLITVDCGITAVKEVSYAKQLGLDIIITDHHEPDELLPAAIAILNPKQAGCGYPDKNLAGVGVAFKLVQALGVTQQELRTHLDLVALGTVADLVPLTGENRIWVYHGLRQMAVTKHVGLKMLLEVSEVETPSAGDLGFRLGPRLNAAGRLGDPSRGVELLLAKDQKIAKGYAFELNKENNLRQDLEERVLAEAVAHVEMERLYESEAIVVWAEGWHPGVSGIVASRLVDRYFRPTVVISLKDGEGPGSARSIPGFHLFQGLMSCQDLLIDFGGHAMAAGLSIKEDKLETFRRHFVELCAASLKPEDFIPKLTIDAKTVLGDVTEELVQELALLEPHGIGNSGPTLEVEAALLRSQAVGRENSHLQLVLQDETAAEVAAVGFELGDEKESLERQAESISLAFVPKINEWRNRKTVQLHIKDWQRGPRKGNYIENWLIDEYPWKLPPPYLISGALVKEIGHKKQVIASCLDLRGTWNKVEALRERRRPKEHTLILVNTPLDALRVCRLLRIEIPGGVDFIGFEHELVSKKERQELKGLAPTWLVSTGYGKCVRKWPSVWFWQPPLNRDNFSVWSALAEDQGQLVLLYGPKDLREGQLLLDQVYPDRKGLARIYSQLRVEGERIKVTRAQDRLQKMGLAAALPFAIGVFSQLELWKVENNYIFYLPTPSEKLDLRQTVLYNKGTIMRKQSFEYLKHCLERGFFQDGLKGEN